ncbi:hypothetical protein, conserved [Eimeria tenella]|uniref:Uncharacterized protein n=1 Tax=Eimeria tenella TaxID=5802 RepID=U6KVI6_EIMTE|nr:hypothetical protein, conserved [Eimeria tenella]CDJ40923.1 hypothetical protein, conserved [Eimeria tenella]|eukprot:XP_013231673.1 hypothetical protein, conserved [Eimeria tenella]
MGLKDCDREMRLFSKGVCTPEPQQLQQLVMRWQRCEGLCFAAVAERMQQDAATASAAAAAAAGAQGEITLQQLQQQQQLIKTAEARAETAAAKTKLLQQHCGDVCLQQLAHLLPEA